MKYSGIDLHSNNSVVTVMDEEDRVVAEKRLPNDLTRIVGLLMPWREEMAGVVVESTFNWYWLVDGLQAAHESKQGKQTGDRPRFLPASKAKTVVCPLLFVFVSLIIYSVQMWLNLVPFWSVPYYCYYCAT